MKTGRYCHKLFIVAQFKWITVLFGLCGNLSYWMFCGWTHITKLYPYTVQVKRNYRLRERTGVRSFECHARRPARSIEFHARRPARSIERITRAISRTTWPARSIPRKPLGNYVRNIKGGFQTQYVQSIVKQFGQNEFSGIFLQHCSIVEEVLWRTLPRIYSIPAVQIAQDQSRDWSRQWSCTYVCDNSRFSRDRMHNSMMTLLFFREIDSDGAWRLSW
jgi:hypothetical protein